MLIRFSYFRKISTLIINNNLTAEFINDIKQIYPMVYVEKRSNTAKKILTNA
jgi:hypothetical protein